MLSASSPPARLVGFALVLLLVLGGGYAIGTAVGPLDGASPPPHTMPEHESGEEHP